MREDSEGLTLGLTLRAMLFAALVVVLTVLATDAGAQNVGRFPLNTPYPEERIAACIDEDAAVAIVRLEAEGKAKEAQEAYQKFGKEGRCGVLTYVMVTYKRQVLRIDAGPRLITVYEGRMGAMTIFVPMEGFLHDSVDA